MTKTLIVDFERQEIIFSSGRHLSVQRCVVGISPALEVFQGHAGVLVPHEPFLDDDEVLTDPERIELADYMIGRWQAFKQQSLTVDEQDH